MYWYTIHDSTSFDNWLWCCFFRHGTYCISVILNHHRIRLFNVSVLSNLWKGVWGIYKRTKFPLVLCCVVFTCGMLNCLFDSMCLYNMIHRILFESLHVFADCLINVIEHVFFMCVLNVISIYICWRNRQVCQVDPHGWYVRWVLRKPLLHWRNDSWGMTFRS